MEEWRRKKIENVYAKWERKTANQDKDSSDQNGHVRLNRALVIRSSRHSTSQRLGSWSNRKRINREPSVPVTFSTTPLFLPSLGVDQTALHLASNLKYSSTRESCQRCLPSSKAKYSADEQTPVGLYNVLITNKRKHGIFGWLFPHATHAWGIEVDYSLKDLRRDVLQSKRVSDAIQSSASVAVENGSEELAVAVRSQQKRAQSIIGTMSSCVYFGLARLVAWLLLFIFKRLFNRVQVSRRHITMLQQAQQERVPIVFLPSHKSHMDYIIMTFVLFNMGIRIPRIAAGDNLRLPLISWLVTHLGGFFIKRRLDTAAGKDILYRKCLQEFMECSLQEGENMEFFIEGSRSRSGKPTSPKAGLLSVLVDTVQEGVVRDILLVPVGISYDVLVERNFVRHELMGGSKRPETFGKALGGVWAMLTRNAGSIRVDFAQPFSLKEYLSECSIASQSQLELTNASHYRSILNMADFAQRKVITALSQHIVHDITHCASLMPTGMVAFLLLTRHRHGVIVEELIKSYQYLEHTIGKKQRSVGYTGEASEAVHYALHYLAPLLTFNGNLRRTCGHISHDLMVGPSLELPRVFELLHHGNQVTPMLALEAVIACSMWRYLGNDLKPEHRGGYNLEIEKEELIQGGIFLCKILSREFIFAPPCVDISTVLGETIDSLVNSDLFKLPKPAVDMQLNCAITPGKKLPYLFGESDDEREEDYSVMLQVNMDEWSLDYFEFLRNVLNPFIEGYWSTTVALLQMEHPTDETEFLKQLQANLLQKAKDNLLTNVESCSMDTLRNAVKSMTDLGYVDFKKGTLLQVVDSNKLMELVEKITDFKA